MDKPDFVEATPNLAAFPPELITDVTRIIQLDQMPHPPEVQWYGMASVVRQVLELPAEYPLNISIHHGIHFNETDVLDFYKNGTYPIFVNRQVFKDLYEREIHKSCYVFGSAHVWFRRLNKITVLPEATGTIAFPAHSSHHVYSEFDLDSYASILLDLPNRFQPVTVCMYWKDLLLGRYEAFTKRGIRVVTAGHLFDAFFIENFYRIIRRFKYSTGNEIGTHAALAIEMGIPYFKTGFLPSYKIHSSGDPSDSSTSRPRSETDWFERLLPDFSAAEISPELAAAVGYAHGCDSNIDLSVLRKVVVENNRL